MNSANFGLLKFCEVRLDGGAGNRARRVNRIYPPVNSVEPNKFGGFLVHRTGAKPYLPNLAITEFYEVRALPLCA